MQRGFLKKRGGTWTAYWYVGTAPARRQHSKGGFATKRDAQAFLNSTLAAIQSGNHVVRSRLTVADYLQKRWLPTIRFSVRPATFDSYERLVDIHIVPRIGPIELQALTADDVDDLYRFLLTRGRKARGKEGQPLSVKTVRYIHTTLHKALKDAQRKQLVSRNVSEAADPPKVRRSGDRDMVTWTADEVRSFLSAMSTHRLFAAFHLSAMTGMRRGEVLGLRWRDVDLDRRRVAVRQTVLNISYEISFGTPKTDRGRRSIALDAATAAAIDEHHRQQQAERAALGDGYEDNGLVFARPDGRPIHPDYFSQLFDRTVHRLGLPRIRLHDLRHTHATLGLAAGVAPKVMSDRLGHATVAFTQDVYMHAIPALESDAAEQVAALIFGPQAIAAEAQA